MAYGEIFAVSFAEFAALRFSCETLALPWQDLIYRAADANRCGMKNPARNEENAAALRYIKGNHSHCDIGGLLESCGRRITGVVTDSSQGQKPFPAMGLIYQNNYFAVARGMQYITLRLPPDHADLLVSYGAFLDEDIGFPGWISFSPFKLKIDLDVWVQEAFNHSC